LGFHQPDLTLLHTHTHTNNFLKNYRSFSASRTSN
jgi:hypothetical protein